MPLYCYRCESCGKTVEEVFAIDRRPRSVRCECGRRAFRSIGCEHDRSVRAMGEAWPLHCEALGVHPSERQAAHEQSVRLGVPTQFDTNGCAVLESRAHRRRLARALGYHDKDGGYGDP